MTKMDRAASISQRGENFMGEPPKVTVRVSGGGFMAVFIVVSGAVKPEIRIGNHEKHEISRNAPWGGEHLIAGS